MLETDVAEILSVFPAHVVRYVTARVAIRCLSPGQRYRDASPALRGMEIDVDAWPVPPAGLFVVPDQAMYLRRVTPMAVAHEFGHALDCALGGGVYRSGYDGRIRAAFAGTRDFVTPYAATGIDEYIAVM
jgi:hypothetical protein